MAGADSDFNFEQECRALNVERGAIDHHCGHGGRGGGAGRVLLRNLAAVSQGGSSD